MSTGTGRAPGRSPVVRLLRYTRGEWSRITLATLCTVIHKLLDLSPPMLIGAAVDTVVRRDASALASLGVASISAQLWLLAGLTTLVWAVESVFEYIQAILWRNLAQSVQHAMRRDAYDHAQRLELAFYEARSSGSLTSILADDVNQLERFVDTGVGELIQLIVTTTVVGASFVALSPEVSCFVLLPMPVVLWASMRYQRWIAPKYKEVREKASHLSGLIAGNISGIPTIKSFTAESYELVRLVSASEQYSESNRKSIVLSSLFSPLIRMIVVLAFVGVMVRGGLMTLDGELTVASYSVMVFLTQRLLWPFARLGVTVDQYQRAMASTTRVLDLIDTPIAIPARGRPLRLISGGRLRGELALENVHYAYHTGTNVLRGLSLTIPARRTTAIVGATGSGKSTIIKLLLRLYDLEGRGSGRITLDGEDIAQINPRDIRRAVALVGQEVHLFNGTVAENIAYGLCGLEESFAAGTARPILDKLRVFAAAQAAEAHDFILRLPQGYDTPIGERGQRLSGGQRQRLAMARAIIKDAPILILDEATSSVDNETEAAIRRSLERVSVGRTTLIIAHRLSTVRHADLIYVLGSGGVVEQGRHDELLARDGQYASLWRVQTGEDLLRHAA